MPPRGGAAAPVMVSNVMSAVADIHRQRQASLQLLEQERTPRSQFLAALIESHKREILEQRWLKNLTSSNSCNNSSSTCCDNNNDEHAKPPAAKKKKVEPPSYALPEDVVEWVHTLKVKQLQEDLHSRNIDITGLKLKKDLRKRLLEVLESERLNSMQEQQQQQQQQHPQPQQPKQPQPQPQPEADAPVPMEEDVIDLCEQTNSSECGEVESNMAVAPQPEPSPTSQESSSSEPTRMSVEYVAENKKPTKDHTDNSGKGEAVAVVEDQKQCSSSDEPMVDAEPEKPPAPVVNHFRTKDNNSAARVPKPRSRSPLKKVGSKVQSAIKALRSSHRASDKASDEEADKVPLLLSHNDQNVKPAASSQLQQSSLVAKQHHHSSAATATTDKPSELRKPSKLSKGSSASKVAASYKLDIMAKKEARRQKLEEIRSKSKPVANSTTTPSLPSLKVACGSGMPTKGQDEKRKLAAKMREKTLRQMKESKPAEQPVKASVAKAAPPTPAPVVEQPVSIPEEKETFPAPTKNEKVATNAPGITSSPIVPQSPPPPSPMETYELSDEAESDSDSDAESFSKPKKQVPSWAQKANLLPALERQYIAEVKIDPDEIFGEVQTCDLEAIFDNKKSRYQRRTSSGNWTQDRATVVEKLTYKRVMGYEGYASEA